ncbi:MAG: glutamine synthetase [Candidatus Liptonbacteria bacterium]|nr:glutamine synthetase [Candidatus Liptonbacteria bacterium]
MPPRSQDQAISLIDQEGVKSIRLLFVDPMGRLKGQVITRGELEAVFERGQGFDGSSVEGFVPIEESDKILKPILSSLRILPYDPDEAKTRTAIFFSTIYNPDGSRFEGDSRFVLEQTLERAKGVGFDHFYCGPEIEFFYFRGDNGNTPVPLDREGYFSFTMTHQGDAARQEAVTALETMGIHVEGHHHEVAPSQHEIDLRYTDALEMADCILLYRMVVKDLAAKRGLWACFMPKPIFGVNGSGMHVHQSLFRGDENAFFDKNNKHHLSNCARHYLGGIFKYLPECQLLLCQWINSYRRLIPGYEAPVYLTWGRRNRSALVRVPQYQPGHEKATRLELRCPDPGCNPYLALAAMLNMGLRGIKERLAPPEPIEENVYHMTAGEMKKLGITSLHGSFPEALTAFKKSNNVRSLLNSHLTERLIESKENELMRFNERVHPWELDEYAPYL